MYKFLEFFQFRKLSKSKKLTHFRIVCPFDILQHLQFCRFSYLPFNINEFRRFIFSIFIFYCTYSLKFGRSTFERSLIFKFEMLIILQFDCSKFWPSPILRGGMLVQKKNVAFFRLKYSLTSVEYKVTFFL